jgi:NADPH:quinone reductase-like Zn-dependent oxidoreductase
MACLARGGVLVTCGATAGPIVELDLRFLFTRELNIRGAYLGTRSDLFEVVKLVADGKLRPVVNRVMPLSEAIEAQAKVARREVMGKIVLTP